MHAPIAAGCLVMLIALAFPFFGVINSFLGAGTTTLETYIIPALAYNWVYWRESAQIACPSPPPWYVMSAMLLLGDSVWTCRTCFFAEHLVQLKSDLSPKLFVRPYFKDGDDDACIVACLWLYMHVLMGKLPWDRYTFDYTFDYTPDYTPDYTLYTRYTPDWFYWLYVLNNMGTACISCGP